MSKYKIGYYKALEKITQDLHKIKKIDRWFKGASPPDLMSSRDAASIKAIRAP